MMNSRSAFFVGQRGVSYGVAAIAVHSPLPLAGEGWGWGEGEFAQSVWLPPPYPSPAKGRSRPSSTGYAGEGTLWRGRELTNNKRVPKG